MKRLYRVRRIGTREVGVVEEETEILAAYACGWDPAWCSVVDITEEVERMKRAGEIEYVDNCGPVINLLS